MSALISFTSILCVFCFIIRKKLGIERNGERLISFGVPPFNRVIGAISFVVHSM